MSIGRICNREVHIARADEPIQAAAMRMLEKGVGCLVVLDDDKVPIGLLTDRDLAVRGVADARDAASTTVGELMTSEPRVVEEPTPIEDALGIMRSGQFRRLPVVGPDRRLVGLATADDLICLLVEELGEVRRLIEVQTPEAGESQEG